MNKKLLVLALAGAFAAPAAMADVTISGTINMGPGWSSNGDGTPTGKINSVEQSTGAQGFSTIGLTSNYSNVNLNSTEDIGDGNKVVFNAQLDFSNSGSSVHENNLNNYGQNGSIRQRNTFLGFEGGWGSLRFGINEHIYERYMYSSDVLDGAAGIGGNLQMMGTPGYGVVFDANGQNTCTVTAGCAGFYRRTSNSVWYDSPDINGFTFGIAQSLPAYRNTVPTSPLQVTKPQVTSLGVQFKPADMPFFVNVAYEKHKDMFGLTAIAGAPTYAAGTGVSSSDTGIQIGGGLSFGDFQFYLRYEQLKYKTDGLTAGVTEYKRTANWLGLKYNLATGYIGVQLGIANDGKCTMINAACNANDSGATMLSGGYAHNLSKQTQLLFFGSITNNKDLASYYNISHGNTPGLAPGADGRSLAVLVKHSF